MRFATIAAIGPAAAGINAAVARAAAAAMPDHGPVYLETDLTRFPVEPWSTFSQLLFLAVILYWAWRIRGRVRQQRFIALCLPLLALQLVGATVYHATRSHLGWMLLDVIPLYLLCLLAGIWFWRRAGLGWAGGTLASLVPGLGGMLVRNVLGLAGAAGMALTYGGFFAAVFAPIFAPRALGRLAPGLHDPLDGRRGLLLPLAALAVLALALAMRSADHAATLLPMGTHWLWHSLGALAVHLLLAHAFRVARAGGDGGTAA